MRRSIGGRHGYAPCFNSGGMLEMTFGTFGINDRISDPYVWLWGAVLGANVFLLPTWLIGGGIGVGFEPLVALRLTWSDFGSFILSGLAIRFWVWLHLEAPNSTVRRDWMHMLDWQVDALVGLLGWGVALYLTFKLILASFWTRRDLAPWSVKVVYSSLVLLLFACFTIVLVLIAIDMDNTHTRERRWEHVWIMRKNISALLVLTGMILGSVLPTFWKSLCRFPELVFICLLDGVTILALDWVSVTDHFFWPDLNHVLELRMSGAVPILIAGVLLGSGVPFAIMELTCGYPGPDQRPRPRKQKTE
jgi:hypothetical protein